MLPPISHQNLLLHSAAAQVFEHTVNGGGETFELASDGRYSGLKPTSGYAVGNAGGWVGEPTYEALLDAFYGLQSRGELPGTFGTWIDGGRLYLDTVDIIEGRYMALEVAREQGQLAIYSFETGEDIRL